MDIPTRHLLLRDRREWWGERSGLDVDADGHLQLARVPGPADGRAVELPPPYALGASGIAAGPCDSVFVADTAHHRIVFIDGFCKARVMIPMSGGPSAAPGSFDAPRGLALTGDALYVCDSGNARVQSLALPALEAHLDWNAGLQTPTGIASDSQGRLYVLDEAAHRVRRFSHAGMSDAPYNAHLQQQNRLTQPIFLTVGRDDALLVSDAVQQAVVVFDSNGDFSHTLPAPPLAAWRPGALVARDDRLYVADSESGRLLVFDAAGIFQGFVAGWRGPVTALALNARGDLLIKPGLDDTYHVFAADAAHVGAGRLVAGPFDAGDGQEWYRAALQASVPPSTRIQWSVAQLAAATPAPTAGDWIDVPADDVLLAGLGASAAPRRHLWLMVNVTSADPQASPLIRQIAAQTPGENTLDFLPAIYGIEDDKTHFLRRLLALMQSELQAVEDKLDDMPRLFDARFTTASALPWLAQWLAFDLPRIADDEERRALLERVVRLYATRGTPESLREFVALYTGIRPAIVEAFETRTLWVLGESSRLGFETGLPPLDPNGMVVPDPDHPLGCADERCSITIGSAVVGESGPLPQAQIGKPLFADTAYRFCVFVPAHRVAQRALVHEICRIVDREKPAHTDYRLAIVEADLRVGLQAMVGVDTVVGAPAPALRLGSAAIGWNSQLPDAPNDAGRIGQRDRVGQNIVLG